MDDWIKGGQNYQIGLRIYLEHGENKKLIRLRTTEGESVFKKQKLLAALQELKEGKAPSSHNSGLTAATATNDVFVKQWPSARNKDKVLQELWEKARLLLKEIAMIHSTLPHIDEPQRLQAAITLLQKDDELDDVYVQRDYYEKHGKPIGVPDGPVLIEDPYLMAARIANLRLNIRREKQAMKKDSDNGNAALRLKSYLIEYNQYMKKLAKPQLPC